MPFLHKQPSVQPRVLCASQCPPHDIYHDISDFSAYYNDLYFPHDHSSLFDSEEAVCAWMLDRLRRHPLLCLCCSSSNVVSFDVLRMVSYESGYFHITYNDRRLHVPLSYVESSSFSFCRLYRVLCDFVYDDDDIVANAQHVFRKTPVWLTTPSCSVLTRLSVLSSLDLEAVTQRLRLRHSRGKPAIMGALLADFLHERAQFLPASDCPLTVLASEYFNARYGPAVVCALRDLRVQSHFQHELVHIPYADLYVGSWLVLSYDDMFSRVSHLSKETVLQRLHLIPAHIRPSYHSRSIRSCQRALLDHVRRRLLYLSSLSTYKFVDTFSCVFPFHTAYDSSRSSLTEQILREEYSDTVISCLRTSPITFNASRSVQRQQLRHDAAQATQDDIHNIQANWPSVVSDNVVFRCLVDYREHTIWISPQLCSVCGLNRQNVVEITISSGSRPSLDFEILHVKDSFITDLTGFQYGCNVIDNCVLDKNGLKRNGENGIVIQICSECLSALNQHRVPRLSLSNYFYRGQLPDEFADLTWVEEMVCAKYRNTAHVTRIFGSSDVSHPKVFHGNTCAHEMNLLSTASVLPRTVADINDMLTIVFVGAGKFDPNCLHEMFTVRRKKIWRFLLWLTTHNRLYFDLSLDNTIMNTYPDNGLLPGLEHRVFENHTLDPLEIFAEETAGFSEHPAQLIKVGDDLGCDTPLLMMEKMGVSDVDGFKISGRSSTASALKNLLPYRSPDLVIHHSQKAVAEYNNPDLMPGMFPTLFPFGLGGFEHPLRTPKVSFQAHVNALLDIPDKSFRRHQSFIFVALNIMQRRLCHLHTHFTVRKSNFDSIAKRLTSLTPDILNRLANHLENEGVSPTLTSIEQDAFSLLRHVNTISARIPGSQSAKIFTRNEIRSYFGEFGLPQLYFTFNPSVTHSPIFQAMVGDELVDLRKQFPFVVPSKERALRLAQDPVAAADFFDFCVTSIFQHLFGWDYHNRKSSKDGGILGHLQAFYGTCEFTERGSLHGHFLIWLLGGVNPNEIHERLKEDSDFEQRFFAYFEDIIQHHLPDVDVLIDAEYEPRLERPPPPPQTPFESMSIQDLHRWRSFMETEVKKLGEVLQRHKCKPVCHKYGNDDKCRFLFPHEIVPTSYFDPASNSVVLKCLDSMVNYFNRYVLVYCRHNHDLKCILSGKAAKAAMCYITDYITKMDIKTYQMLSLLSRAVASVPIDTNELPTRQRGRTLLHKCLTQFTKQQQVHAQQAARYLRGKNDTVSSHDTCPLMSGLLLNFISAKFDVSPHDGDTSNCEDDDHECAFLKIQTDSTGKLITHNQLTDYWYRPSSLSHMNFYDFARCVSLQTNRKQADHLLTSSHMGIQKKHLLLADHPLAHTHHLLQHTNDNSGDTGKQYVPRVIGSNIPCEHTGKRWKLFALAHFKPFDDMHPLLEKKVSIDECYENYHFSDRSRTIMRNWEDIHECEDERDNERLRKKASLTTESLAMTNALNQTSDTLQDDDISLPSAAQNFACKDFLVLQTIHVLEQSQWLSSSKNRAPLSSSPSPTCFLPAPSPQQLKEWMTTVKNQENSIARKRQSGGNALEFGSHNNTVHKTEYQPETHSSHFPSSSCTSTVIDDDAYFRKRNLTFEEVITTIGEKENLQPQQWIAFRIIARSFLSMYVEKKPYASTEQPLRMLLTGPGGTGKTHVVKAVQKVMEFYNAGHTIRFLAPTGSAASLIDGMTIHKGLGIKVQSCNKGKGNRILGTNHEDYSVIISVQNKIKLRNEWRFVEIVMIDECSLLSAELLSEIDAALRFAKERPDEWFGGVIVIFAGDFFQYPPVCATPLYNPIPLRSKSSSSQLAKRLGRLAWKSINAVISFNEQNRMKEDPGYATAVTHLRTRECTMTDVDLFNTRVIRSATHEHGIDMSIDSNFHATAIVRTNLLRQTMNFRKAETNAYKDSLHLTNCAAVDTCSTLQLSQNHVNHLLHLDMSSSKLKDALPGFLPLYIGMPIVLKSKNISTDLGITNGCQGYVREYHTNTTTSNFIYCTCVFVEFPESKVLLPNLPPHYFPIIPVKTTFITQLTLENGKKQKCKISRSQLPIQPAFAVTGHSAEGKTLPTVLTNLNEGGFAAYVAASRARSRQGLYITETVNLDDLNKPLPYTLIQESDRLQNIEHNTYVRYGFSNASYQKILNPESEHDLIDTSLIANFDTKTTSHDSSIALNPPKRKQIHDSVPIASSSTVNHSTQPSKSKKRKEDHTHTSSNQNSPLTAGCVWSSQNWSCAYDCVVMSIIYAFLFFNDDTRLKWSQQTTLTTLLTPLIHRLITSQRDIMSNDSFNQVRDILRDYLSHSDPTHFQRFGAVGAPVHDIFEFLINTQSYQLSSTNDTIPTIFFSSLWTNWTQEIDERHLNHHVQTTTQEWIDLAIRTARKKHQRSSSNTTENISTSSDIYMNEPPPLLAFEITPDIQPKHLPSLPLHIATRTNIISYQLRCIIYHGQYHFTSRLFDNRQRAWIYDGQQRNGLPSLDHMWSFSDQHDLEMLTTLDGRYAHMYIYATSPDP